MHESLQAFYDEHLAEYVDRARELAETPAGWAVAAAVLLLYVLGACRVFSKAGFHGLLGLLMLLPPFTLLMPLYLAFGPWPVRRELRSLRRVQRAVHKADYHQHRHSRAA